MTRGSVVKELPSEARPIIRGNAIEDLRALHKAVLATMKLYPSHFSEYERIQLRRIGLEASGLAHVIEERK